MHPLIPGNFVAEVIVVEDLCFDFGFLTLSLGCPDLMRRFGPPSPASEAVLSSEGSGLSVLMKSGLTVSLWVRAVLALNNKKEVDLLRKCGLRDCQSEEK